MAPKYVIAFSRLYAIVIRMANRIETKDSATSVLSVRVSTEERTLLEAASEQARTSLSDFVRRKALDAAEVDVLDRSIVTISAKDWAAFEFVGAASSEVYSSSKAPCPQNADLGPIRCQVYCRHGR